MEPTGPRVLIFTATYNERDNIERLVQEVLDLPLRPDVLVVDDNSPDGTGEFLRQAAAAEPRLHTVHRPRKMGLGSAHKLGMTYAIKRGYDVLVTLDADFSHAPRDVLRLVERLGQAAFVIGSRYAPGATCEYRGYRKYVSIIANKLAAALLGIGLHEFTTSFRAFDVKTLQRVDYASIRSQGYSFFMETVWHISRAGQRCVEVPIYFSDRIRGQSKIPRFQIVAGALNLLRLAWRRLMRWRKPSVATPLVGGVCQLCGSDMRVQLYPASSKRDDAKAAAYRCTSMEHGSKPQVVQCLACGLVAAGQASAAADILALYSEVADETYLQNRAARERAFERVLDGIVGQLPTSPKVLEVGSHCGVFLEVAQRRGLRVVGVEPSRWAVAQAQARGLTAYCGTARSVRAKLSPPYDAVAMWDVLEHLSDPVADLRDVRGLLADNGLLYVSTLDMSARLPRLLGRRWQWIMDMHLFFFSTEVLHSLFREAGFELIEARPYWHYASVRYIFEKAGAILPAPLAWLARLSAKAAPRRLLVPVYLGDVKLFVCRKVPEAAREIAGRPARAASA
jgi:dolichol-phosphate mannosyltransferase